MKKSHQAYLRRLIGKAIAERNSDDLTENVLKIKSPDTETYRLIRDIVCDSRFYSVTDEDAFWKTYGSYRIGRFLDSITPEEWEAEETLTLRKEEFLNVWMTANMIPLTPERRAEIEADIRIRMIDEEGNGIPDPDDHEGKSLGVINLGNGIKDRTEQTGLLLDSLPPNIKKYMDDAQGSNSQGVRNDGHTAEARFLNSIDPSLSRLAEIIGRHGGEYIATTGKFRPASKSDISGVTDGNDLNSLLPTELALLASTETEKVFLDRYARKRLQVFSSVSRTKGELMEKRGPIFICIDTSGSMVGQPEETAKTLALTISIIAQNEKRPVCIFNYSDDLSFFVLKDLKRQRMNLMRFLSGSYGGGNDENKLLGFIFGVMPKKARYRDVAYDMKGADMLVISDFRWIGVEPPNSELLLKARKKGMRIFSVGIGIDQYSTSYSGDEGLSSSIRLSGLRFFNNSDQKFRFEDGVIKEMRF